MNRITKSFFIPAVFFFLLMVNFSLAEAQRRMSDYEELAFRKNRPQVHYSVFTLPGNDNEHMKLTAIFQLSNNFLPFKKLDDPNKNAKFYSTAALNLEVFKAPDKIKESPKNGRWRMERVDVDGLQSVGRDTWQDTAYAANYDLTKSDTTGLNGSMQVNVTPGYYTYLLKMNQEKQPEFPGGNRGGRGRDQFSGGGQQTRNVFVPAYNKQQRENVFLIKKVDNPANPSRLDLINMGDNVTYGKDFYAFIHLPDYQSGQAYSLQINRIELRDRDTTRINQVWQSKLSADQIIENVHPQLLTSSQEISLKLNEQANSYSYALVKIPNAQFPNAVYRLTVVNGKQPIAAGTFRSYWSDIPTSLLNLDVAIDMLHYTTDKETIKKIDDGSYQEREQKFREFWAKKDPTPNTEFNELEAEYYRRIDYAYDNFGSQDTPGYDTDRGRIYINYGPPQDTKRTFPTDGPTTEIWTYPNRTFVFKATSGFGDFELVSQNSKK